MKNTIVVILLLVPELAIAANVGTSAPAELPAIAKECRALEDSKQFDKAFTVCTEAVKTGNPEAKYRLGLLYEKGTGVARDLPAALKLYLSAAEQGHPASQRRVAAAYYWGLGGLSQDNTKAFEWFKRAAEGGDTRAQKQMAEAYRRGVPGVLPKDEKLAREWQERAERANNR